MLRLKDVRTDRLVELTRINGAIGVYVCGPTVAGKPHLGHLRTAYAYDLMVRWLRSRGEKVLFVQNITDIDDKILTQAQATNRDWRELARSFEADFATMRKKLGILEPDVQPRATEHIPQIVELISLLLSKGAAYRAKDGSANVYYSVQNDPEFGSFTHQTVDSMLRDPNSHEGESVHATGKRFPLDFALWKAHKAGLEPESSAFLAPWGLGRPGWHVEDTAMARVTLGEEFSLHGGGRDLRLPHHESEVAQARGAGYPYAKVWAHSGLITVSGAKMAKSKDNFVLAEESYHRNPNVLRFLFTRSHYSSDVEYSEEEYESAAASWQRVTNFLSRAEQRVGSALTGGLDHTPLEFIDALELDLNTPEAYGVLFEHISEGNRALERENLLELQRIHPQVIAMVESLGFDLSLESTQLSEHASELLRARASARLAKDFELSDQLRERLKLMGVTVRDTAIGQEVEISRNLA